MTSDERPPSQITEQIADHYEQPNLLASIEAGLVELGKPIDGLSVDDLAAVDEFHVGGRVATTSFLDRLDLGPDVAVLDIGCGLGGPARLAAATYGCAVTGIDLTASYIEVAKTLTEWVGLEDRVVFHNVSAHDMTFDARTFDAAYMIHVGMNVADKASLFAAVFELVKPGSRFGLYDLVHSDDGDVAFPLPWAESGATSFVETQTSYETSLAAAGFEIIGARERPDMAHAFIDVASGSGGGPSPIGLHLVMGPTIGTKVANLAAALRAEVIAPVELIARRPN